MTAPKINPQKGRPVGSRSRMNQAFEKAYKMHSKTYGDPVEFLFRVFSGADQSEDWGPAARVHAAVAILKRQVPELRSIEANVNQEKNTQLVIVWDDDSSSKSSHTLHAETATETTPH